MKRSRTTATGLVLLAVGGLASIAACGGPASGSTASPAAAQTSSSDPMAPMAPLAPMAGMTPSSTALRARGEAAAPTAVNTVAIKNFAFTPSLIQVRAGTTVTWTNQDQDAHTVTGMSANSPLRSPTLQTGATYRFTFTTAGRYDYLCTIHPFMTATVVVTR